MIWLPRVLTGDPNTGRQPAEEKTVDDFGYRMAMVSALEILKGYFEIYIKNSVHA